MITRIVPALAASCLVLMAACNNATPEGQAATTPADSAAPAPLPAVAIAPVSASPAFDGSSLAIGNVKATKVGTDSAKVAFDFVVKNFELKMQTTDNGTKNCNNSAQGQHIHFILDNKPYKALYEPKNEVVLANNTEHYLMAFLSRSYHESVKSPGAAIVYHFSIDAKGGLKKLDDPKTPMVFYSRPKGDYIGTDTSNLLLDYYVWNCNLATDGYKVSAEITNTDHPTQTLTTKLDKWEPVFINNLMTGKSKVTLTLTDKDGKAVEGPMTTVSRDFQLSATEPVKP